MKNRTHNRIKHSIRNTSDTRLRTTGFTVIELIVALMVSFVILTALVTLAYSTNSAYNSTREMNQEQSYIRYSTLKITDLIQHSMLICDASSDEILIWRADDNNDNQINSSEVTYIETGSGTYLRLLQFDTQSKTDSVIPLYLVQNKFLKALLKYKYNQTYTTLLENCTNMSITLDKAPYYTQSVTISFDMEVNHQKQKYEIKSTLRCPISNLIDAYDAFSISDDDLK